MSALFIYLSDFTYSSIYSPFFPASTRLQMRVCTEQIRRPQPRTEGTEPTRSEREKVEKKRRRQPDTQRSCLSHDRVI